MCNRGRCADDALPKKKEKQPKILQGLTVPLVRRELGRTSRWVLVFSHVFFFVFISLAFFLFYFKRSQSSSSDRRRHRTASLRTVRLALRVRMSTSPSGRNPFSFISSRPVNDSPPGNDSPSTISDCQDSARSTEKLHILTLCLKPPAKTRASLDPPRIWWSVPVVMSQRADFPTESKGWTPSL